MKDPNKLNLGLSVDVASLNNANKVIQTVTSSIQDWIVKVRDLAKTTGTFDDNLQHTLQKTGQGYQELDKTTSKFFKNSKKNQEYAKSLKETGKEQTKWNKNLKDSSKGMTNFVKNADQSLKMTSKNQKGLRSSLKSSMSDLEEFSNYKPKSQFVSSLNQDLDDFTGFDEMSKGLRSFGNEQDSILQNLNDSLDSVCAQTGRVNEQFDDTVLTLASLGDEIQENEKKSLHFGEGIKNSFEKMKNSASTVGRGMSKIPGGLMSAGKGVGKTVSAITSKMNELQGSMRRGFSSVTSVVKDSAFSVGNLFPPLMALGGAAGGIMTIKGAFESAWQSGQELEKMTVKMTNRFGSSEYAKKATGFINDMSQEYGIAKDELSSYTEQLGEMGMSVDKVNFKGVLNAANGPGKDLQSTMAAMTALAKGGDFQSFTESFGNTIDPTALQESLAGASTYQERMQKTADFLDGQFAGNTDRMKNSTEGQIASISGFFEKLQQTISGSGAFRAMQDVLTNIFKTIEDNKESILAVGQVIGSMMGTVIKFIGSLLGNVTSSMGGATDMFKSITTKIKDIFYPLMFILAFIGMKIGKMIKKLFGGDLAGGVTELGDIIAMLIDGITGLVGKVFDVVTGFFSWFNSQLPKLIPAVVGAVGKIIDAIVGFAKMLGTKIAALWPELLKTLGGLIKMIIPIVKKLLIGILEIIADWAPKLVVILWDTLKWVAEQLIYIGPALADAINEGLSFIGKWISDWIGGLADRMMASDNPFVKWLGKVLKGVQVAWDAIISVLQGAVSKAGEIIASLGEFFSSLFSGDFMGAGGKIFDIFDNLGTFISDTFSKLFSSILGYVSSFLSDISDSLMNSDNPFMNFIGGTVKLIADGVNLIKNIFSGVFSFIGGVVSDIGSLVGNVFGNLFDFFKNLFTGNFGAAWDNIKNIFGAIWDFIKSLMGRIWSLIWDTFSAIGTFLWDTLKNIWKTFTTILGNIFKGVGDWIANMWNSFIGFLTSLPGKFVDSFLGVKDAVLNTIKDIPGAVIDIISFIPRKILELLKGGFSAVGNLGESIFGEGFFDPLVRMFKGFMNTIIKALNHIPRISIPLLYDDSGIKDQAKEMATTVGQIMADPTRSTDFTPVIKKLHDQVETLASDQGTIGTSAMAKAYQSITDEMYKINGQIGAAGGDLEKKQALMAKLVDYTATLQQLPKSNLSKTGEFTESKSAEEFVSWIKMKSGNEIKDIGNSLTTVAEGVLNKTLSEQKGNAVQDAIVKDGKVHPMDPKDQAVVSKDPGFLKSLAKGDIGGAVSSFGANVKEGWGTLKNAGSNIKEAFMNSIQNVKGLVQSGYQNVTQSDLIKNVVGVANLFKGQEELSKTVDVDGKKKVLGNQGFATQEMTDFMKAGGYTPGIKEDSLSEGAAWCAAFVRSAYSSVFKNVPAIWNTVKSKFTNSALGTLSGVLSTGLFEKSTTNPMPGSLMGWKSTDPKRKGSGHLGLVTAVDAKKVTDVEGNTGSGGEGREGYKVSELNYPLGKYDKGKSLKFVGFANPKFDDLLKSLGNEEQPASGKLISPGSKVNPGKDFVMRPGEEPMFFEPTDTVFGVRKAAGLNSEGQKNQATPSTNNITFNFTPGSIQITSVNPQYDAKKLLSEMKDLMRKEQGRIYGAETLPY